MWSDVTGTVGYFSTEIENAVYSRLYDNENEHNLIGERGKRVNNLPMVITQQLMTKN